MIPEDWLERLKAQTDLLALGRRYGLVWQGKKACCPFHTEDTPSFHAIEKSNKTGLPLFRCYGACSQSWDPIEFVRKASGKDFHDAVAELAADCGLEVPKRPETDAEKERREAEKARKEKILDALMWAQDYFVRALQAQNDEAAAARAYVDRRQLTASVEPWGLGLCPKGQGLVKWLDGKGVSREIAEEAYLTRRRDDATRYAFLWNRLTIPWRNRSGQVVAHVGRALSPGQEPKYLNPGDVPGVFTKGELVWGLFEAQEAIRRTGVALVAEGQVSALTPHLHGLCNFVCVGGTAFTAEHARLLAGAGAHTLVVCTDGDAAGRDAKRRILPTALAEGLHVKMAELPLGQDPDDYLRGWCWGPEEGKAA